jgi:hypothetical protein
MDQKLLKVPVAASLENGKVKVKSSKKYIKINKNYIG